MNIYERIYGLLTEGFRRDVRRAAKEQGVSKSNVNTDPGASKAMRKGALKSLYRDQRKNKRHGSTRRSQIAGHNISQP